MTKAGSEAKNYVVSESKLTDEQPGHKTAPFRVVALKRRVQYSVIGPLTGGDRKFMPKKDPFFLLIRCIVLSIMA